MSAYRARSAAVALGAALAAATLASGCSALPGEDTASADERDSAAPAESFLPFWKNVVEPQLASTTGAAGAFDGAPDVTALNRALFKSGIDTGTIHYAQVAADQDALCLEDTQRTNAFAIFLPSADSTSAYLGLYRTPCQVAMRGTADVELAVDEATGRLSVIAGDANVDPDLAAHLDGTSKGESVREPLDAEADHVAAAFNAFYLDLGQYPPASVLSDFDYLSSIGVTLSSGATITKYRFDASTERSPSAPTSARLRPVYSFCLVGSNGSWVSYDSTASSGTGAVTDSGTTRPRC